MRLSPLVLALSLGWTLACAGIYHPLTPLGGYTDIPTGDGRYEVSFSAGGGVPEQRMEQYLLYRCAQVTLQAGKKYFVVEARTDDPSEQRNTYAQYREVRIRLQDERPAEDGDWYEAQLIKDQLAQYISGPHK